MIIFENGVAVSTRISTTQFQLIFAEPTKKQAFNLDLVILACFANEPISMMAATFQSDINHQFKLGEPQQKIKHYIAVDGGAILYT